MLENWLIGDSEHQLEEVAKEEFNAMLINTRNYFEGWVEDEVKECWEEFEKILNYVVTDFTRKFLIKDPVIIIANYVYGFLSYPSFKEFMKKWWTIQRDNETPFIALEITLLEHLKSLRKLLGNLFILKNLSIGNILEAKRMVSLLYCNVFELSEGKIASIYKEKISLKNKRAATQDKRSPIRRLIDIIIKERRKQHKEINIKTVIRRLESPISSDTNICVIESIDKKTQIITYSSPSKTKVPKKLEQITFKNLEIMLSKAKKSKKFRK